MAGRDLRVVELQSRAEFRAASLSRQPNTVYRFDGFEYATDELGRGVNSSGILRDGNGGVSGRFYDDYLIGRQGIADDIGFHGGADRFGFQGGPLNISPGNRQLNSDAYFRFEDQLAGYVSSGETVNASFTRVFYEGNTSIRPDEYKIFFQRNDGPVRTRTFLNQPGG